MNATSQHVRNPLFIGKGRWERAILPGEFLILLVCGWFVLCCNGPFWAGVADSGAPLTLKLSLGFSIFALHAFLIGLFAWGRLLRPMLGLLLVVTAAANWYMLRYAIVFDSDMVRNILQTDPAESREMLSAGLLLHVLLFGILPAGLLFMPRLEKVPLGRSLRNRGLFLMGMIALASCALAAQSQSLFALMRIDPVLRHRITPGNYLLALQRAAVQGENTPSGPKRIIASDAHRTPDSESRPRTLVLVVGETVRADHWGLNGYERQTTPLLAARDDVINFSDVTACGTSTAVSLPCMFSPQGRENYDRNAILSHESLLDVLKRVGIDVVWRDNQAGCKGVCDGVETRIMRSTDAPELCRDGRCLDEILLHGLDARIGAGQGADQLIVLHMLGNHGPNYFERYPAEFERFHPTCRSAELSRCTRDEIINAYDNAVLYTDAVLAQLIEQLEARADRDTALLYISDHGESLGEYGIYLHGAPYRVAPSAQTKVPMFLWTSRGFQRAAGINRECLKSASTQARSHDDLFHTLLGVFGVETGTYRPERDLLQACRGAFES